MEGKSFRNYALGIGYLILAGGLVFAVVWLSTKVPPTDQFIDPAVGPFVHSHCTPMRTGYVLTVTADNFNGQEDLKDVQCEIALTSGLVADPKQQSIGDVIKGTSNHCLFSLRGDYEGPVSARVKFNNRSFVASSICAQPVPFPIPEVMQ